MWDKIVGAFGGDMIKQVGDVADKFITTPEERAQFKQGLTMTVTNALNEFSQVQADVLQTEMKGNFLQRSWRPITMLAFVVILICKWFGLTAEVAPELELELMGLLKIGIGGYIGARSLEKVTEKVTKNIDLSGLRRKDRAEILKKQLDN